MKWNSDKSLQLSIWCTRLTVVLAVGCAIFSPRIVNWYINVSGKATWLVEPILISLLACCVPALGALFWLHKLLTNIAGEHVFTDDNVSLLRRISWCCFLAALITVIAARFYLVFGVISIAAAFMGLILRVVKNVIQQAVIIKNENELTI
ncbi:MAG: DUF2975 domain-containing protein [Firmicutes bacterium]|nr:DUF2975 domain-containing protein [Bacillota bacterium]